MRHEFIEHAGIESYLRIPVGNESGGCDLGEFESQYPFVYFLMKGFGHYLKQTNHISDSGQVCMNTWKIKKAALIALPLGHGDTSYSV